MIYLKMYNPSAFKIELAPFITRSPNKIPTVITAEANIFSVRVETKIPIAIKHIPSKIRAMKLPIIIASLGGVAPSGVKTNKVIKFKSESAI